jgi:hypothetical protein
MVFVHHSERFVCVREEIYNKLNITDTGRDS